MDPVTLTQKLVQIESTDPGTGEEQVADFLEALAAQHLPDFARTERLEVLPGRPLVRFVLPGRSAEELVFLCHMDTVPFGHEWTRDPLGAELVNGRIYGRGACDMKSGLACAFAAFLEQAEACTEPPAKTVQFIASMDEEADMRGVESALAAGWIGRDSRVLDAEPTDGCIQTAHKGRYWFRYTMHGKAAHASEPWTGADAIAGMALALSSVRRTVARLESDPFLGKSTVTFGSISGGTQPYQVPDTCTVTVDMRVVPPYTIPDMTALLETAADEAAEQIPGLSCTVEVTGNRPPVPHHEDSELLRLMKNSVKAATGKEADVTAFPGYTDTAVLAGTTGNPNTLSYGPGSLSLAHKPDEYVEVADIERCHNVYLALLAEWLS